MRQVGTAVPKFQPDSASKRSHNLHETYQLPCVQQITPDDGHRRCPKHVEFYDKINFGYLMHLVGCFIRNIPGYLHFDVNKFAGDDQLAKIRHLISLLVQNVVKFKTPDAVIVIDETMVPFRRRLIFKQYTPGKASTYSVKLSKFCDSKGYAHYLIVCGGKMEEAAAGEDGRAISVVVRLLMKDYIGESRTPVTDNVLNNLDLAHYLLH
jgi:hypothetical protein